MSVPSSNLRARVLSATREVPARSRAAWRTRALAIAVVGVGVPASMFAILGAPGLAGRAPLLVGVTVGGWALAAATLTRAALDRRASMLGRSTAWLVAAALVATPLLAAFGASVATWLGEGVSHVGGGAHALCFIATTALSLGPLGALVALRAGSDPVHPRALGGALGAAAGAWGGVAIELHCPAAEAVHVALAHAGPIALMAALGATLGARFVALR